MAPDPDLAPDATSRADGGSETVAAVSDLPAPTVVSALPAPGPTAPPQAVRGPRARHEWMDTLRGGAILLMLLWHAVSIPRIEGVDVPAWLVAFNDALLPFRMPTLMFLSGLLLPRSLAKPTATYYRGKVALIAWPYLVWVWIFLAIDGTNGYPLWTPQLYIAKSYLWFLFYIGCFYAVAPLLRRPPAWVPPLTMLVACVVVTAYLPHRMLFYGVFFFTGAWVARSVPDVPALLRGRRVLVAVLAAAALGFAVASGIDRGVNYDPLFVPLSLAGVAVAVLGAASLPHRSTAALRYVGRSSIVYYASHFPVMLGVVAVCLAVDAPWWVTVPALVLAGLAVGTLLTALRDRIPVRWLFEAPFLARRPRVSPTGG